MSLATRCTACGTIFRVVQDQLKVSEGWVRCGRCHEVFNGSLGLFDLDRDAPPAFEDQGDDASGEHAHDFAETGAGALEIGTPPAVASVQDDMAGRAALIGSPVFDPEPELSANRQALDDQPVVADADEGHDHGRHAAENPVPQFEPHSDLSQRGDPELLAPMADAQGAPDFVRQADRRQRWNSMPVRVALIVATFGLMLLGLAQLVHHWRDRIAAQWPQTQPALVRYCEAVGCRIEALRRIEAVSIEHSALSPESRTDADDALKLTLTLHNKDELAVSLPAIDLTLTAADGAVVSRRALLPSDFGVSDLVLPPGGELPLGLYLRADGPRVTGYTVEVFYP
jgi:predicted Zn finger-like uncharacterized protein